MYSEKEGEAAVRLARWSIDAHLREGRSPKPESPESFSEESGAFVTLQTYPREELRGCIGYAEPIFRLEEAIVQAAITACHDPRFPPLSPDELDHVVVEVSLLEPPELLEVSKPLEYSKAIVLGRHGLIVSYGDQSGLLLPQVPLDWGWRPEEFLSQACVKAGLLPDAWFEPGVKVYKFGAEVFKETEPRGPVVRRELSAVHDGHRG